MKHLVAREHHPHLKKRAVLELIGFFTLLVLSYDQRELLQSALTTLRQSDLFYVLLMICVYWLLLPLTSISYRIILNKPLPLKTTVIAQLAGAGAGRIIPGGLGHIIIAAAHIAKSGSEIRSAIATTVLNNIIGVVINVLLVVAALVSHPTLFPTIADAMSPLIIIFITAGIMAMLTILQWLSHARNTKKTVQSIIKELVKATIKLMTHPNRIFVVMFIALTISTGHVALLILSGSALGIDIMPTDALIALGVGILMGSAVPTTGGFGAVETGTTTALIVLGFSSQEAVSTALLFRAVTYWMPLIPGTLAYLYLRERKLL